MAAPVVRLLGREGTVLAGLAFMASCFLVLWLSPDFYILSYPAFICFGVGWSICLAPLQARLMETAGERAQLALALNASAFFAGQGLGALAEDDGLGGQGLAQEMLLVNAAPARLNLLAHLLGDGLDLAGLAVEAIQILVQLAGADQGG